MTIQELYLQNFQTLANNFLVNLRSLLTDYSSAAPLYVFFGFLLLLSIIRIAKKRKLAKANRQIVTFNQDDLNVIAGENVIATQLDLARAYVEMGKNNLAKTMLFQILKQGTLEQRQQAKQIIDAL